MDYYWWVGVFIYSVCNIGCLHDEKLSLIFNLEGNFIQEMEIL